MITKPTFRFWDKAVGRFYPDSPDLSVHASAVAAELLASKGLDDLLSVEQVCPEHPEHRVGDCDEQEA